MLIQQVAVTMNSKYSRPRLPMVLALNLIFISSIQSLQFGQETRAGQLRSKYKLGLDLYRNAARSPGSSAESEQDVRIQHKRAGRSGGAGDFAGHVLGTREAEGGFLSFKDAPAKLVEAREHGKLTLECSASGSPTPNLAWYKDGQPIIKIPEIFFHPDYVSNSLSATQEAESEEKSLGVAHAKLSLDCLTEADAGYYECVAEQGQKTESVASEVHVVSYGAGTCSKALPHTTAPKISQYYTTFMMEMGLDAHLKCLTVGKHSTEWLGPDDESLPGNSDKYQILPDGSLIIKTLTFDDMGVYQCMVKNSYGHDMAETFVYPVAPMY